MLNTFHQTSKYSKALHIFWWQISTYFGSLALVKCFCILSNTFVNKSINKSFPFRTTGGDLLPSWSLWHWSLPRKRFGFLKDAVIRQGQTWDLSKNYTAGSDKSHLKWQGHFSLFRFLMIRLLMHLSVSDFRMSGQKNWCANYCSKSSVYKNLFNFVDFLLAGNATSCECPAGKTGPGCRGKVWLAFSFFKYYLA